MLRKQGTRGSVAFEYLIVSIFTAVVGSLLLGLAAKMTVHQVETLSAKMGIDIDTSELEVWKNLF